MQLAVLVGHVSERLAHRLKQQLRFLWLRVNRRAAGAASPGGWHGVADRRVRHPDWIQEQDLEGLPRYAFATVCFAGLMSCVMPHAAQ